MDVKLPRLGEGAESGTVVTILVKAGDRIAKGQTIVEMENEKAVAPIPSPVAGIVASIRVPEGDQLSAGPNPLPGSAERGPAPGGAAAEGPGQKTETAGKTQTTARAKRAGAGDATEP